MAILTQEFETLVNSGRMNGKHIDKQVSLGVECTRDNMAGLLEKAKIIHNGWTTDLIDNAGRVNFGMTDDMSFSYLTAGGERRKENITSFAFQQLCSRIGVPAQYVDKCFKNGKTELAMQNFRAWADDYKGTLKIMRNDNVTRAVVTDGFSQFDSYQILRNLMQTVNMERWTLVQSYLAEDKMVLRFVDNKSPIYEDKDSKLYVGFMVSSSDVGKGALNVKMFVYRQRCTNGLIVSKGDATLYKQAHIGAEMTGSKLEAFARAMYKAERFGSKFATAIDTCRGERLSDKEFALWMEKTTRDLKLSKKNTEKLVELVDTNYERNMWGVINGVTELAHDFTLDTRIDMERWAGELFGLRVA